VTRLIIGLSLISVLAACGAKPSLDAKLASDLRVEAVTADVDGIATAAGLLPILGIGRAQVEADIANALEKELVESSRTGTRPVIVDFRISTFLLPRALFDDPRVSGSYGRVEGTLQIRDARTGEILVKDLYFSGNDNLGRHTIASSTQALFSPKIPLRQAYDRLLIGFPQDVWRQIFTSDGFLSYVN
jgi:hypothetical protein